MCRVFYKSEFFSTFEAMAKALDGAIVALRDREWIGERDEACLRLCLEEAMVNAIRHGNQGDAQRKVCLEISDCGDCCKMCVRDEGNGFCPGDVHLPDAEAIGGRGICLMRHFMDDVRFNAQEHCLEMVFSRKCGCNGDSSDG